MVAERGRECKISSTFFRASLLTSHWKQVPWDLPRHSKFGHLGDFPQMLVFPSQLFSFALHGGPEIGNIEFEARQDRVACELLRVIERFPETVGTVDVDLF